jgi:hypothetical protein
LPAFACILRVLVRRSFLTVHAAAFHNFQTRLNRGLSAPPRLQVCEVTYGRVQGRETLVEHFKASKFPSDDIDFMPLVYSRVEAGVASHPLAIHQYLGNSHGGEAAANGNGVAAEEGSLVKPAAAAAVEAAAAGCAQ